MLPPVVERSLAFFTTVSGGSAAADAAAPSTTAQRSTLTRAHYWLNRFPHDTPDAVALYFELFLWLGTRATSR
uniref:Putative secreted protein n=1 Tax=Anopheles triannulatus TaxID=58253 RepID=A0A2M4B7R5_9DIPT